MKSQVRYDSEIAGFVLAVFLEALVAEGLDFSFDSIIATKKLNRKRQ